VEWVQNVVLAEGGEYPGVISVAKLVSMSRQPGWREYLMDGRKIAALVNAGYLGRIEDNVYVTREMLIEDSWKEHLKDGGSFNGD
jgi:hypothetical protein